MPQQVFRVDDIVCWKRRKLDQLEFEIILKLLENHKIGSGIYRVVEIVSNREDGSQTLKLVIVENGCPLGKEWNSRWLEKISERSQSLLEVAGSIVGKQAD